MIIKNPLIIAMLTSLLFCSTSCPDEEIKVKAEITDFTIDNCDNSGDQIKRSDVVPAKAYAMKITYVLTPDKYDYMDNSTIYILSDTISSLEIKTIKSLNQSYPAGSKINDLFKSYTIDQNSSKVHPFIYSTSDIKNKTYYNAMILAPEVGKHQFEMTIVFKSGKTLSKRTQPVTIY